ncbi:MAG: pyruvate kinase [Candidatus Eremiobacteraeota bacterium]|nr:pyruvate kinase [Candidatus Eremiobacteraeota bacterium]
MFTRTKIVCTIGPACWDEETLRKLIRNGMDVARLNFSHGTHDSHKEVFYRIRKLAKEEGVPIAIMQDLCGPKIRLGEIPNGPINLKDGQEVALTGEEVAGTSDRLHVSYPHLVKDLKVDEPVLIDDGIVQLKVKRIRGADVICEVTAGGDISSHKGVNLPESQLQVTAPTEKDIDDLKLGMELGVDFVALSFVRTNADIRRLKEILDKSKRFIPVIAKIEKREAVLNLDKILASADAAMVARGDLGAEIPIERVPHIQKEIIRKCNILSKPVITATQMLDSMIRNPIPTRAEVTDVANAILDGTDAVMLSGETASGKYPIKAIQNMDRIARESEKYLASRTKVDVINHHDVVDSISLATCQISCELDAKAILVLTDSGRTARLVSRYKPDRPILAITPNDDTVRKLMLSWGVIPLKVEESKDTDKALDDANKAALASGIVKDGDLIVTTAGIPTMVKGSTNMIKVDVLGSVFLRGTGVGPQATVIGKVCVCKNADEAINRVESGDILIVRNIDESYLPVANKLAGLVVERGTQGSYADYYCTKFKIPGLLNVPGATSKFFSGRIVSLDTEHGIIYEAKTEL